MDFYSGPVEIHRDLKILFLLRDVRHGPLSEFHMADPVSDPIGQRSALLGCKLAAFLKR